MESSSLQSLVSRISALDSDAVWQLAGWTMIHFLWVGAILAGVAAGLRLAVRRARAPVRYLAALLMLGLLAASPVAVAVLLVPAQKAEFAVRSEGISDFGFQISDLRTTRQPIAVVEPRGRDSFFAAESGLELPEVALPRKKNPDPVPVTLPQDSALGTTRSAMETFIAALPYVWLVGASGMLLLFATGLVGGERLRRRSQLIGAGPVADTLENLRRRIGGRSIRRMAVAVCNRVTSPVLIGVVRPLVLLPPAALTGWSPEQIEMVLLHELAHVRRWDNFVNLLQRLIEALLFFHPAVWWLSGWVRQEREHCCDAFVVLHLQQQGRKSPRDSYAHLLLEFAAADHTWLVAHPGAALAARNLRSRIRQILNMEEQPMRVSLKTVLATIAVVTLTVALTTTAARGLGGPAREEGVGRPAAEGAKESLTRPDQNEGTEQAEEGLLRSKLQSAQNALATKIDAFLKLNDELDAFHRTDLINSTVSNWQTMRARRQEYKQKIGAEQIFPTLDLVYHRDDAVEAIAERALGRNSKLQQLQMQMMALDSALTRSNDKHGDSSHAVSRLEERKQELQQEMERIETAEQDRLKKQLDNLGDQTLKDIARDLDKKHDQFYRNAIDLSIKQEKDTKKELAYITTHSAELAAMWQEISKLSEWVDELIQQVESAERGLADLDVSSQADDAVRFAPPNIDQHEGGPSSAGPPTSDVPQSEDSGGLGQNAQPEAAIPPPEDSIERKYERTLAELTRKREEYYKLAEQLGGSADPEQNLRVKMALTRWQANRAERRALQRELANAYLVYQTIIMQDRDPAVVEKMLKEAVSANPSLQQLQMQMLWIDAQIARVKMTSGNRRSSAVARLEDQKRQLGQQMQQFENQERQRLMHEHESSPSLIAKLAKKQYEAQARIYQAQIDALDKQAAEIQEELKSLTEQNEELAATLGELIQLVERCDELSRQIKKTRPDLPLDADGQEQDNDSSAPEPSQSDEPQAEDNSQAAPEADELAYNGKNFAYWKNAWRTELNAERRTEIIRALAAFGAHGHGREAAEAVLDIVQSYSGVFGGGGASAEKKLLEAAAAALAGGGFHIPFEEGFAVLARRLDDSPQLAGFAARVIEQLPSDAIVAFPHLLTMSTKLPDYGLLNIVGKLKYMYPHLPRDAQERAVLTFREALKSPDYWLADAALGALYNVEGFDRPPEDRAGYVPELLDTLQHPHHSIRGMAMSVLAQLGDEAEPAVPKLIEMVNVRQTQAALAALAPVGAPRTAADHELQRSVVEQLQIMNTLRSLDAAPEDVVEFYATAEPVLPKLYDLLLVEGTFDRAAIVEAIRQITGSFDAAEEYLRDVMEKFPRGSESARALGVLQQIEDLRREESDANEGAADRADQ